VAEAKIKAEADAQAAAEQAAATAQKAAADEEAKRLKDEEDAKLRAIQAAERAKYNGPITVVYEISKEQFTVVDGALSVKDVDTKFMLSEVMPKCMVFLSTMSPSERCDR
jgi:hypothetical protein